MLTRCSPYYKTTPQTNPTVEEYTDRLCKVINNYIQTQYIMHLDARVTSHNTVIVSHPKLQFQITILLELRTGNGPIAHYQLLTQDYFNTRHILETANDETIATNALAIIRNVVRNFIAFS